jgi:hypothetical protein
MSSPEKWKALFDDLICSRKRDVWQRRCADIGE